MVPVQRWSYPSSSPMLLQSCRSLRFDGPFKFEGEGYVLYLTRHSNEYVVYWQQVTWKMRRKKGRRTFSVRSRAPWIMVVSSCVNSPPFPAYTRTPHKYYNVELAFSVSLHCPKIQIELQSVSDGWTCKPRHLEKHWLHFATERY